MSNPKRRPTITEYLRRFDCHGVNWILSEDNFFFRMSWTSLIIAVICVTIYYSSYLICEFNDSPVISRSTEINVKQMQYPKTLICSPEIFNYTKLREDNFSTAVLDIVLDFYFTNYQYRSFGRTKRKRDLYNEATLNDATRTSLRQFSVQDFLAKYGYKCEEMLLRCLVNNVWFSNCCMYVEPVLHALHGQCYLLHSDRWTQTHVSPTAGITLTLASMSSDPTNLTSVSPLNQGIYLELMEIYEYASSSGLYFEPNQTVILSLKRTTYDRSQSSNIGCLNAEKSGFTSSTICESICWIRQYQANCNCTKQIGYYPLKNRTIVPFCHILNAMNCLSKNIVQYNENYLKCLTDFCKPLCGENVYTALATISSLKTNQIKSYIPKNLKNFNGFVQINMIYHSMMYEKVIEYETLTWHSVISLLGGQIGFWFGGSIITILQAIIIGFAFFKRKFRQLQNFAEIQQPKEMKKVEKILTRAGENPIKTLRSLALGKILDLSNKL